MLLYSFKVFKYVILTLGKKIHFRENWLIFWWIWGEAELFLGIWGAKANNFRDTRKLFSGIWGDQCIIFRDLGSTYPPGGLKQNKQTKQMGVNQSIPLLAVANTEKAYTGDDTHMPPLILLK